MATLLDIQKCRSWEEQMYWKHFKLMHFCCVLPDDFNDRLVLPKKFAENMITELPSKVLLFGPSGVMWDVNLTKTDNVAFVGDEWNEFVKAYDLKATYLLMFKYRGSVGFEVLIFDPDSLCEKEAAYFVKKQDKLTTNINNNDDREKKRKSVEAFGTGIAPEIIEHDENNDDDFDFVTSKRAKKDSEDPASTGETNNGQTPLQCSSGRVKQGGSRSRVRGKPRKGRISSSHRKAKNVGMTRRNKAGKEQPVVENWDEDLELGRSHESSEIRGKKQTGNEGAQSGEGNLEIVQSPKPNETSFKKGGQEQPVVENGESNLELVHSHESCEIRGVEEHINSESREGNLETLPSSKLTDIAGKKTNGSEPVKELNIQEDGESIRDIVRHLKCYKAKGKKLKDSKAAKEQHGTNLEIVHSPKSIEVIGNASNGLQVDGRTAEINACTSTRGRGRPRKQSVPRKNNLVYEKGDKSNKNEAAIELNGSDTGALTPERVSSDKTSKIRGRTRRKLKLEGDSAAGSFAKEYVSDRRSVTEKQKENALQRADQGLSDESFIAVMRPTTVYRRYYLNIPSQWAHEFLPRQNHEVVLRMGDKTWPTLFYCYSQRGAGLAGAGWKKFVIDNHLEEFDVCLFKLTSHKGDVTTVLDVNIFRVIPETVSPTVAVPF